jgi:hypothetical protein
VAEDRRFPHGPEEAPARTAPLAGFLQPAPSPIVSQPAVEFERVASLVEPISTLPRQPLPTISAMQAKFLDSIAPFAPGVSLVDILGRTLQDSVGELSELSIGDQASASHLIDREVSGAPLYGGLKPTTLLDMLGVAGVPSGIQAILIEVPEGEPIRIGPGLTDPDIGGPEAPPSGYPGKPPRVPRGPSGLPEDPEWWKKTGARSAEFLSAVYCCFDFFARFTADDVTVAEKVPIKEAFSDVSEPLPDGHPQKDPAHPERRHASAQFDQGKLQEALDKAKKVGPGEHVFWNDLEDIEIVRKEGTGGQPASPPAKKEGETEEEKKKREEEEAKAKAVKEAADAIKPGKLKIKVKIKDKKPPAPKPGGSK